MKITIALTSAFLVLSMISCDNANKSQDYDKSIMPEENTSVQTDTGVGSATAQGNMNINPSNIGGVPGTSQPLPTVQQQAGAATMPQIIQQAPPTAVNNTPSASNGLNPAHGAPGHRCEIPVGSPLNSAPSATVTQPQAQTITTTANPTTKTTTAPGMNPAHGEPGHRCDISVGAPLNSKPAEVKTSAPQVMPALTPVVPAKEQESKKSDQ